MPTIDTLLKDLDSRLESELVTEDSLLAAIVAARVDDDEEFTLGSKVHLVRNGPAPRDEIHRLQSMVRKITGRSLPDDYVAFLATHNGLYLERAVGKRAPAFDASFDGDGLLASSHLDLEEMPVGEGTDFSKWVLPFSQMFGGGGGFAFRFHPERPVQIERYAPKFGLESDLIVDSFTAWFEHYVAAGLHHVALERGLKDRGAPLPAATWQDVIASFSHPAPTLLEALWTFVEGGGVIPLRNFQFVRDGSGALARLFPNHAERARQEFDVFARLSSSGSTAYLALWSPPDRPQPLVVRLEVINGIVGTGVENFIRYVSEAPDYLAPLEPDSAGVDSLQVPSRKSTKNDQRRAFVTWGEGQQITFAESDIAAMIAPAELIQHFEDFYQYLAYSPQQENFEEFRNAASARRTAIADDDAKLLQYRSLAPSTLNLDEWLGGVARQDLQALEALTFWARVFPHQRAGRRLSEAEQRGLNEREHLIAFLLEAFEVDATKSAASSALESLGYSAHLVDDDLIF